MAQRIAMTEKAMIRLHTLIVSSGVGICSAAGADFYVGFSCIRTSSARAVPILVLAFLSGRVASISILRRGGLRRLGGWWFVLGTNS